MLRYPAKANLLAFLQEIGVPIGTILDVGAHEQTEDLRLAFPDKRHILFEPAVEFHPALARNYAQVDHVVVPFALSSSNGEGALMKLRIDGGELSHAKLVDSNSGEATETIKTIRLDTFMANRSDVAPYLLKVDVDGYEIPILEGAEGILPDVSVVVIEATTDTLAERLNFLLARGFRLFDIIDQCYYYGVMSQVDLVLIAERFYVNANLRPWETKPFSWDKWVPMASFEPYLQTVKAE